MCLCDVQKRRRKTFGNSDEACKTLQRDCDSTSTDNSSSSSSSASASDDERNNKDDNDDEGDDFDNDPDWVSGLTPGRPSRSWTVQAKVGDNEQLY